MPRLPVLGRELIVAAVLLGLVAAAAAQDAWHVTRLRTANVTLFDCKDGSKKTEYAQKDFQAPWPILAGPSEAGLLTVKVGADQYCVRAYAVETNKPVAASSDCGALVAANQPKAGATRGVGGADCKK